MSPLFDPGLQPERTELAWRRTALALGVGSLLALRLLPPKLGDALWALVGVAGVAASALVWCAAARRAADVGKAVEKGDRVALPGGVLLLLTAGITTFSGAAGLWIVVANAACG